MKKLISIFILAILVLCTVPTTFTSCTSGLDGDGTDSIYYPGNTSPQNSSYRNPVWEPDFELGTIFKGPATYVAISSETQWAAGITYCGAALISSNLMDWTFNPDRTAFMLEPDSTNKAYARPEWAEGRIHSMSGNFARTITSSPYWLFYQIGDTPAIGVASATSPQGPYKDLGKFLDVTNTSSNEIKDPFFIVIGTRFYLFYSTEDGSYIQEITLRAGQKPGFRNAPEKISNSSFSDVAVYRKGSYFYIFGTVKNGDRTQINYARAEAITGPYLDGTGNSLLSNDGMLVIDNGDQLINPTNVCGIFADFNEDDFILYNVTDITKPTLASGYNRRPLMLNKLVISADGWIESTIKPYMGWTSPKFIDKDYSN